jgi:hypothetical protein
MLKWFENTVDPDKASAVDVRIMTNAYGSWDAYKQWYAQQIIGEPVVPDDSPLILKSIKSMGYVGVYREDVIDHLIENNNEKEYSEMFAYIKPIRRKNNYGE